MLTGISFPYFQMMTYKSVHMLLFRSAVKKVYT